MSTRSSRVVLTVAAVGVLALGGTTATASALVGGTTASASALVGTPTSRPEQSGALSSADAPTLESVGEQIPGLTQLLSASYPTAFGGAWLDDSTGVLHVRFSTAPADASAVVATDVSAGTKVQVDTGGLSAADLKSTFASVRASEASLREAGFDVFKVGANERTGAVDVTASTATAAEAAAFLSKSYGASVNVVASDVRPMATAARTFSSVYEDAGLLIAGPLQGSSYGICSSAFSGITSDGHLWL